MTERQPLDCEVALVYLDPQNPSWPSTSILLQPQIIRFSGQDFLSGYAMAGEGTWANNRRINYRLTAVNVIIEFETLQEYEAWKQHLQPSA